MAKRPCSICGAIKVVNGKSRPDMKCHTCRRIPRACSRPGCTGALSRKATLYCSLRCFAIEDGRRRRAKWGNNSKHRRADRDRDTEGIRWRDRKALLRKWKQQQRACYYGCGRPGDTIDHLIPLVRGGTSYEGNLVPCCRACNSSKQDRLPIEYRLGRVASSTYMPMRNRARAPKPQPVAKARALIACIICGTEHTQRATNSNTCSTSCSLEKNARATRDRYRARHGIPPDPKRATRPRVREF